MALAGWAGAAEWSENLLRNPQFEALATNGAPAGWQAAGWRRTAGPEAAAGAPFSLETESNDRGLAQSAVLKAGADYRLTFHSRIAGDTNTLGYLDVTAGDSRLLGWTLPRGPDWRCTQVQLPRPAADTEVVIQFRKTAGTGALTIAGVALRELAPAALRDLLLADFESDLDLVDLTRHGNLATERSADYASRGYFSMKVAIPALTGPGTPTVEFHLDNRDLLGYRAITCDVFNPLDEAVQATPIVNVTDSNRVFVIWGRTATLEPCARTPMEVTVAEMVNGWSRHREKAGLSGELGTELRVRGFYIFGPYSRERTTAYQIDNLWLRAK